MITFVGGGNMATAMIGGLLRSDASAALHVIEVDPDRARQLTAGHRVTTHSTAGAWMAASELVVLAVKPQQAREACEAIKPWLGAATLLSIAAGLRAATIARWIGSDNIVRAMPNTPALIGCGISGAVASAAVKVQAREAAERVLRAIGEVIWLDDEAQLDPVTAVSGSGPAYVFLFAEAMQQAAIELGLHPEHARLLTLQTFIGAARQAQASDEPLATLRERVTSKGGTTAAALASLDKDQVVAAVGRAVRAASQRATELGDLLDRTDR